MIEISKDDPRSQQELQQAINNAPCMKDNKVNKQPTPALVEEDTWTLISDDREVTHRKLGIIRVPPALREAKPNSLYYLFGTKPQLILADEIVPKRFRDAALNVYSAKKFAPNYAPKKPKEPQKSKISEPEQPVIQLTPLHIKEIIQKEAAQIVKKTLQELGIDIGKKAANIMQEAEEKPRITRRHRHREEEEGRGSRSRSREKSPIKKNYPQSIKPSEIKEFLKQYPRFKYFDPGQIYNGVDLAPANGLLYDRQTKEKRYIRRH